jgi:hypothetical protein
VLALLVCPVSFTCEGKEKKEWKILPGGGRKILCSEVRAIFQVQSFFMTNIRLE